MITHLGISNFRTLHDLEWKPRALSLLVGANNAGKTNICFALRFLQALATMDTIDSAAEAACGAASEVRTRTSTGLVNLTLDAVVDVPEQGKVPMRYDLSIAVAPLAPGVRQQLSVYTEHLARLDKPDWPPLIDRAADSVSLFNEGRALGTGQFTEPLVTSAPPGQAMLARLYVDRGNPSATAFKRFISGIRYYRFAPDALRRHPRVSEGPFLASDGANIASVIYTMKNEQESLYRQLLTRMSVMEPTLEFFSFIRLADGSLVCQVSLVDDPNPQTMNVMSDGSLLYLALLTLALQSHMRPAGEFTAPTLVVLEEPENGLFSRRLVELSDLLVDVAKTVPLVVTTHSPFLLDRFDSRTDDVFVVSRGASGASRISSPDPSKIAELLEHTSLGELLFNEVLTV